MNTQQIIRILWFK